MASTPTTTTPQAVTDPSHPDYYSPANQKLIAQQSAQKQLAGPGNFISAALDPIFSGIGSGVKNTAVKGTEDIHNVLSPVINPQLETTQVTPQTEKVISELKAGKSVGPKAKTPPETNDNFDLQNWLNQQLAPYNKQLEGAINQYQNTNLIQPWMPQSIRPAISNMEKLVGKSLSNLMPATLKGEETAVQSGQATALEQLLPSALIYHTLSGTLPGVPQGQANEAIQNLWKLFQNINVGLPNPATATGSDFLSYLQNLNAPGATPTTTSSTTG